LPENWLELTYAQRYQQIVLDREFAERHRRVGFERIRLAKVLWKHMHVAFGVTQDDLVVAAGRRDDIGILVMKVKV
jgi:hypothetical protein